MEESTRFATSVGHLHVQIFFCKINVFLSVPRAVLVVIAMVRVVKVVVLAGVGGGVMLMLILMVMINMGSKVSFHVFLLMIM